MGEQQRRARPGQRQRTDITPTVYEGPPTDTRVESQQEGGCRKLEIKKAAPSRFGPPPVGAAATECPRVHFCVLKICEMLRSPCLGSWPLLPHNTIMYGELGTIDDLLIATAKPDKSRDCPIERPCAGKQQAAGSRPPAAQQGKSAHQRNGQRAKGKMRRRAPTRAGSRNAPYQCICTNMCLPKAVSESSGPPVEYRLEGVFSSLPTFFFPSSSSFNWPGWCLDSVVFVLVCPVLLTISLHAANFHAMLVGGRLPCFYRSFCSPTSNTSQMLHPGKLQQGRIPSLQVSSRRK